MTQIDPKSRRNFLKMAGVTSAAATAVSFPSLVFASAPQTAPQPEASVSVIDTVEEIFTAALIAEDLATTFYYNALVGSVINDVNLSGPHGSATVFTSKSHFDDVFYLRAALAQEMEHANLFRTLLGSSDSTTDPNQTFYFDPATFADFATFIAALESLEQAFIGAYMSAIKEFVLYAASGQSVTVAGTTYAPHDFTLLAKIASTILGVESEHRVLGRTIGDKTNPANNFNYEQGFGVYSVFNGNNSAVAKLGPYLSASGGGQAYSLQTALGAASGLTLPSYGTYPRS